jgi:transketolase
VPPPPELLSGALLSPPDKPQATRVASGEILNRLAPLIPNLLGGSADLAPSTRTLIQGSGSVSREDYAGRNLHFGVREHAMAAMANGLAAHGGLLPYVATFLVFSDYMKPALRLSALMGLPVLYIFTHDSIGVGEDGPTHQPVEHLAALRSIPNLVDFRPADYRETAAGWYAALKNRQGPTALILTRQEVPQLPGTGFEALKGAYILAEAAKEEPDVILMASGSEVQLILQAQPLLAAKGIAARVVSMPSLKLFEKQEAAYREFILPSRVTARLAVEAASSFGWHRYTGPGGAVIALDAFGASAPGDALFRAYGFTVDNVVQQALALLHR